MNVVTGDLLALALDGQFDVIVHGCNCQCQMGKGIALSIKNQFPEAYEADLKTTKADRAKLGTISVARIERSDATFDVVNAYTQFHWRGEGILADYDAIRAVFKQIKHQFRGKRIGYPKIGAGLAKGDWDTIAKIIDQELVGEEHALGSAVDGVADAVASNAGSSTPPTENALTRCRPRRRRRCLECGVGDPAYRKRAHAL
jgi:O-acetyl-ADP-ribose deacetylase (regulator of RNase III)